MDRLCSRNGKITRHIAFLTAILLLLSLFCLQTDAAAADVAPALQVQISISGGPLAVTVKGSYSIRETAQTLPAGSYTISAQSGSVNITGNGINTTSGATLTLLRNEGTSLDDTLLSFTNAKHGKASYLGNFIFSANGNTLSALNHVDIEQYLYGVVPNEMSNSWPIEALKAQAVCARGYAYQSVSSAIGDTASAQVYKGYNANNKNAIAAVDETKGLLLTYNGKPITPYYAASNGGYTELAGNAWGKGSSADADHPYLVIKEDPYDIANPSSLSQEIFIPASPASELISIDASYSQVVRIVRCNESCNVRSGPSTGYSKLGSAPLNATYAYLGQNGDGSWINFLYNGQSAWVSSDYALVGQNGTYTYQNCVLDAMQQGMHTRLRELNVSVATYTDLNLISINWLSNTTQRWPNTGSMSYAQAVANVTATAYGNTYTVDVPITLMNASSSGGYLLSHNYLNANLRLRYFTPANGGWTLINRRFGHGVGMSQRGAQQMASSGLSYADILAFYYVGTTLTPYWSQQTPPSPTSPYTITGNIVTGVLENTTADVFTSQFNAPAGFSAMLCDTAGTPKITGVVVTGDTVVLTSAAAEQITYAIVIRGDANADGRISIADLLRIQKHLLGTVQLEGAYFLAADITGDGNLSIQDLLRAQKHLLAITLIVQ